MVAISLIIITCSLVLTFTHILTEGSYFFKVGFFVVIVIVLGVSIFLPIKSIYLNNLILVYLAVLIGALLITAVNTHDKMIFFLGFIVLMQLSPMHINSNQIYALRIPGGEVEQYFLSVLDLIALVVVYGVSIKALQTLPIFLITIGAFFLTAVLIEATNNPVSFIPVFLVINLIANVLNLKPSWR